MRIKKVKLLMKYRTSEQTVQEIARSKCPCYNGSNVFPTGSLNAYSVSDVNKHLGTTQRNECKLAKVGVRGKVLKCMELQAPVSMSMEITGHIECLQIDREGGTLHIGRLCYS